MDKGAGGWFVNAIFHSYCLQQAILMRREEVAVVREQGLIRSQHPLKYVVDECIVNLLLIRFKQQIADMLHIKGMQAGKIEDF